MISSPDGQNKAENTYFVLKEDGTVDESKSTIRTDKNGVLLVEDGDEDDDADSKKSGDGAKPAGKVKTGSGSGSKTAGSKGSSVKTGDESHVEYYWLSGLTSLAVLILLLMEKKKQKK